MSTSRMQFTLRPAATLSALAVVTALGFPVNHVRAEAKQETAATAPQTTVPLARRKSPYQPGIPPSGRDLIALTKGVSDMRARRTNAGNLIRFSYRVTNAELAKALTDKGATPFMVGHTSHAMLEVPVMDKVGPLRQSTRPEEGKEYWMVFSNKGDVIKVGERVSVVIGQFRVDGLLVE